MPDHVALTRSRRSGAARLWRGWIVALLAVLLAAGGHQAAHSITHGITEPIPWELLAFSTALTAPVAVALASRGISAWSTGLTTVFGQLAFHLLYSLPYTGTSALPNGHHHGHGPEGALDDTFAAATHQAAHSATGGDSVMLGAHVLAAAVTIWVIVRGERSLVTLVAWLLLAPVKLVLAARPPSTGGARTVLPVGRVWIPHPMNFASTRWSRGPPVLA